MPAPTAAAGNGQHPRPHDLPGHAPAHGGQAARGGNADDRALRPCCVGADADAELRGDEDRHCGSGLGRAAAHQARRPLRRAWMCCRRCGRSNRPPQAADYSRLSEQEPRAQLDLTRGEPRAADSTEVGVAEPIVRVREVGLVEQVEHLHPQLEGAVCRRGPFA